MVQSNAHRDSNHVACRRSSWATSSLCSPVVTVPVVSTSTMDGVGGPIVPVLVVTEFDVTLEFTPGPEYTTDALVMLLEKMSRYHPESIFSSFMSASVTAVMVNVRLAMVAVATADMTNTVPEVIAVTVAPVGMPEPNTDAPGLMFAVDVTVTLALPLVMADRVCCVAVPAVSMLRTAVTPDIGVVRPSRRVINKSIKWTVPSARGLVKR